MALRGVNFSCSLIVLAMISTTFSIFNASKNLPDRGNLPAWAPRQKTWPQITLLCIACVSLAMSLGVIFAYFRGGHRRAEKAAVYYTVFAVGFFAFSIIMWAVGAAILNESKRSSNGQDMWGWSCKDNKRKEFSKRRRLRPGLPPAELVLDLRLHRDHCRGHHHLHLRHRLLPLLFQAPPPQIYGPA